MEITQLVNKGLVRIMPGSLKREVSRPYLRRVAYSQEGEDLLLGRIFDKKTSAGFFVDVGAHDPVRFSNTYTFYLQGWRGINIDPLPGSSQKFQELRPDDVNLEMGIANEEGELNYYVFKESAFNTFSKEASQMHQDKSPLLEVKKTATRPLAAVLDQYSAGREIDFMSIDVEGFELNVLASNRWDKYLPKVVVIEDFGFQFGGAHPTPVGQFLQDQGYAVFSKMFHSVFYVHEQHRYLIDRR